MALLQLQLRKQGGSLYSPRCPTSRTCERCGKQLTAGVLEGKLVQHVFPGLGNLTGIQGLGFGGVQVGGRGAGFRAG